MPNAVKERELIHSLMLMQGARRPALHGRVKDGLPKEATCEQTPKMGKEPSHVTSRSRRYKHTEPRMVSDGLPMGQSHLLLAPTSWGY